MQITSLVINDLRSVRDLKIEPCPEINFIVGNNGAGKTTVLEAIYLAGRGRTFRHVDAGPMIRTGSENAGVLVEFRGGSDRARSILGLRREKKSLICRLNGRDIRKRSDLAEALPVQWIGSQPQLFLGLGPEVRRRFVDMGLFHVERSYLNALGEFQRYLRQRNAAIRLGGPVDSVRLWNKPFAKAAERIDQFRTRFIDTLMSRVYLMLSSWHIGYELTHSYRTGWKRNDSLPDLLNRKLESDLRLGYTSLGPQRADLEFQIDGSVAEKRLSRGQQKQLVLALNLSLMDLIREKTGRWPILLIDDLAAEFDPVNRALIIEELETRGTQVFLTKIEDEALLPSGNVQTRRFHVEHGSIVE